MDRVPGLCNLTLGHNRAAQEVRLALALCKHSADQLRVFRPQILAGPYTQAGHWGCGHSWRGKEERKRASGQHAGGSGGQAGPGGGSV